VRRELGELLSRLGFIFGFLGFLASSLGVAVVSDKVNLSFLLYVLFVFQIISAMVLMVAFRVLFLIDLRKKTYKWGDIESLIIGRGWFFGDRNRRIMREKCAKPEERLDAILNYLDDIKTFEQFRGNKYRIIKILSYLSNGDENAWEVEKFTGEMISRATEVFRRIFDEFIAKWKNVDNSEFFIQLCNYSFIAYKRFLTVFCKSRESGDEIDYQLGNEIHNAVSRIHEVTKRKNICRKEVLVDLIDTVLYAINSYRLSVPHGQIARIMWRMNVLMRESNDYVLIQYMTGFTCNLVSQLTVDELSCFLIKLWLMYESRWSYYDRRFHLDGGDLKDEIFKFKGMFELLHREVQGAIERIDEHYHNFDPGGFSSLREVIALFLRINRDSFVCKYSTERQLYLDIYETCCRICSLLSSSYTYRDRNRVVTHQVIMVENKTARRLKGVGDDFSEGGLSFFADGDLEDFPQQAVMDVKFSAGKREIRVIKSRYWSFEDKKHILVNACFNPITKTEFEEQGLDFETITPALVEKNYIFRDNRVNPEFERIDSDFKGRFTNLSEDQFSQLENILVRRRDNCLSKEEIEQLEQNLAHV